jgi:DNA methylase
MFRQRWRTALALRWQALFRLHAAAIRQLYRVICRGGIVVWIVADATTDGSETGTSFRQALYFKGVGFNTHDTMIWKRRMTPQTGPRYEPGFEYMFVFSKGAPRVFNPLKCEARYQERARPKIYHRLANETAFTHRPLVSGSRFVRRDNVWDIRPTTIRWPVR